MEFNAIIISLGILQMSNIDVQGSPKSQVLIGLLYTNEAFHVRLLFQPLER